MDYAYRVIRNVKYFYNSINPAHLSGAIDVVVVEQPNGEFKSTPFHVRFGKYAVFSYNDKYVDIAVNGEEIDLKMKLADSGVAFFVAETDEQVPDYLLTSPLPEQETSPQQGNSDIDKILAESARKLEQQKYQTDDENMNELLAKSRSSSPDGGQGNAREPKQEQSLSQVQRKQTLPFSSSVFSDRKYRSLPDLTVLDGLEDEEKNRIKRTKETEDVTNETKRASTTNSLRKTPRPFKHSQSQTLGIDRKFYHRSNEEILRSLRKEAAPSRKKSRVTFEEPSMFPKFLPKSETKKTSKPINIEINGNQDSESDLDSSVNSSPTPSLIDQHDVDRCADGALSDSEFERQRVRSEPPEPHDVTDWKWGELPETREFQQRKMEKEKNEKSKKSSTWSWLWYSASGSGEGSSSKTNDNEQQVLKNEDQGIPLDDLLNQAAADPINIEKYIGKPPSLASIDSGNVSSRGISQPSSPISRVTEVEMTPTRETLNNFNKSEKLKNRKHSATPTPTKSSPKNQRSRVSSEDLFPLSEDEMDEKNLRDGPQYVQSLRLSSEKLKSLGLVFGANECRFSITTKFQGTTWCSCNIYLYKWYEQIVISDIDGTITKSDVLGHVIPAIGGTWAHAGVAELYSQIKNNGYKMVYLSSRAIGQSHTTKQYLKSVAQDSKQLPDGPVLLSPTSIITAFRREVIERRPEEFKIAALTDLKQLFPNGNPYYAGFGNRDTDVVSYRAVNVPPARILIIDPSGRVKRSDSVGLISSYTTMANETADYLFPPLSIHVKDNVRKSERLTSAWSKPLEHSNFTHWASPNLSTMDIDDEELQQYENQRKISINKQKAKK